jgi:hypothetical protein
MDINRINGNITIKEQSLIESYDFNSEINFKKLMEFLLSKNLSEKVSVNDNVNDPSEVESNLIEIIKKIINDYNDKVDELEKFKSEYSDD